jgi:hypothetical protein
VQSNDEQDCGVGSDRVSQLGRRFCAAVLSAPGREHQSGLETSVRTSFRMAYSAWFLRFHPRHRASALHGAAPSDPAADLGGVIFAILMSRG